ncbi:hypothetical protein FOS14_12340 [Skermania sp. ID1734]|uniref:hypothetical protein n=1 Tax=Skermania sp. ID1734 TaxID=2597516 RepID=UPI00117E33F3|nr:hypothetical protein [Skermania sp. ID1734]TSD99552.1 hypothetical protein FOS14_12340 [Skermania sp. ID1734]
MSKARLAVVGSVLTIAVGGVLVSMPDIGSAASPGLDTGAQNNGDCTVTFAIDNRTNATTFTMDYWIDDEPLTGKNYGTGPTGRRPPLTSGIAQATPPWPQYPYARNISPAFQTTQKVDLKTVANLPNPDAATHTVHYRIILGPESQDFVAEKTVTVTGCPNPPAPTTTKPASNGSSGSS